MKKKTDTPKDKQKKALHTGPADDCTCPICIFTKSQAPGAAYDLSKCPRCRDWKDGDDERRKKK